MTGPARIGLPMVLAALTLGAPAAPWTQGAGAGQEAGLTTRSVVHHVAAVAVREPMVVEHPGGDLFVAGYTRDLAESLRPPKLFRSRDGGDTWSAVDVGSPEEGAVGNSDVDLMVAPDGTIYFLTMGFDRSVGEGTHVAVGVSRDVGDSWVWTELSRTRFDDRPWIAVAPDGAAHVIWNDGEGVRHAVSGDGGRSWEERERIYSRGHSSHLAVGPAGEIAVRITPVSASGNRYHEGVDLLAVSIDGGISWRRAAAPGTREWSENPFAPGGLPRWVEPVAWDADGALYSLWSEGTELWLARSGDRGESWESWRIATGVGPVFYPYLIARGSGTLAATWFAGRNGEPWVEVALIEAPGGRPPSLRMAELFQVDAWVPGAAPPARDPAGEYVPVAFLADGDLGVVTPIQDSPEHGQGFTWRRLVAEEDE